MCAEDLYIVGRGYCLDMGTKQDTRYTPSREFQSSGEGYCVGGYSKVGGKSMEQCADRCRADLRCNGFSLQTDNTRQCLLCPTTTGTRYSLGYEWLTFNMGTRLASQGSSPVGEIGWRSDAK